MLEAVFYLLACLRNLFYLLKVFSSKLFVLKYFYFLAIVLCCHVVCVMLSKISYNKVHVDFFYANSNLTVTVT